jgi:shikimate kinase
MHTRIYLIGFMGSGKSTQGKKIARMMGYDFLDMDEWIEEQEGMPVPEIFREHGEAYFRKREKMAIRATASLEKTVIATGGGAPCHGNNMELLKASGLTVYLKLTADALISRLTSSKNPRPLLEGKTVEEIRTTVNALLIEREAFYNQADMIIDGLERVNERIVNAIQRRS